MSCLSILEQLRMKTAGPARDAGRAGFGMGLAALDQLAPDGLPLGAVHEVIAADREGGTASPAGVPRFFALLLAQSAAAGRDGVIVWSDPLGQLYPPALSAAGVALERVFLLRVNTPADELWAVAECLKCKGVAATVAIPDKLTPIQARRLQLAAEQGGGIGVLIRRSRQAAHYAAATRWLVSPVRGDPDVQRWSVELMHCHGRQVGRKAIVEVCRDSHLVRASEALAERSNAPAPARAWA